MIAITFGRSIKKGKRMFPFKLKLKTTNLVAK